MVTANTNAIMFALFFMRDSPKMWNVIKWLSFILMHTVMNCCWGHIKGVSYVGA